MLNYLATGWTFFVILTIKVNFLPLVRTVDTDVVVILLGAFFELSQAQPLVDIWIAFGMSKNYRFYNITTMCNILGEQKSRAIPVFHSLTGSGRAVYQTGIWTTSTQEQQSVPSPHEFGWIKESNSWAPVWIIIPEVSRACSQLIKKETV